MSLNAIHVNWTKPFFSKNGEIDYRVDDFELLSTILSALLWRKLNGDIKLYTDNVGLEFYSSLGILDVWNLGVDADTLENIPASVSPDIFWAAGKIFAVRNENTPFVVMDTDLMVWLSLPDLSTCHLMAFHRESLATDCYIPYESLRKRSDYHADSMWNWSVEPCNTALTYFNHRDFKEYYTRSAIDFMDGNFERPLELVSQMVFAEQRIFSMCADRLGVAVHTFLDKVYDGDCDDFTHLWGTKSLARKDAAFNRQLCGSLLNAIKREAPWYEVPRRVLSYVGMI